MRADSGDLTYRPRSRYASTIASWAVIAGLTAAQGFEDGMTAVLRALPLAVALGLVAWLVFWHPRVDVTDHDVVLVNPLRTIRVPWAALINVETQYALALVTPGGRYRAWAAPGPGRHQVVTAGSDELVGMSRLARDSRGAVAIGDLPSAPSGRVAALVRRRWEHLAENGQLTLGAADETPVETTWNRPALVVLAVALVGVVVVALT
ncbi:PH domain-containing protein [Cellulomonas fengjieae]|uniref:PH domain-containing protein n=1 Tax=Cellulomonas fengjieae TaxID=2819978 RepID=A0ABS3SLC7_9CELL|nr:PH domain-containing protein [Cellulomonas fengjieae]MBO3086462.1 PH domain-containing protein [Cellulomonas fengjieae]MBO3100457.1 PH domain-containing protein [Cellulomonas fengjieae]QVI66674.1 PH domain-containing protein [Cellulomonas fengjieae]